MSKRTTQKGDVKKLEYQIKPILEKLTYEVLQNKPNNIVSVKIIYIFNSLNICLII